MGQQNGSLLQNWQSQRSHGRYARLPCARHRAWNVTLRTYRAHCEERCQKCGLDYDGLEVIETAKAESGEEISDKWRLD